MLDISARLGTFSELSNPDLMVYLIREWILALSRTNLVYLQLHPDTVPLYDSGVYYQEEKMGHEDFFDIPEILYQGYADCEDLSAWRVAEYWSVGQYADPIVTYDLYDNGDILFHVRVQTQYGIEDPSRVLGMP